MSPTRDQHFGKLLKELRLNTLDPERNKEFTQSRLAEILEIEEGVYTSFETISRWETGARTFPAKDQDQDQKLKIGLLRVLHRYALEDGLQTRQQADALLKARGIRDLTDEEAAAINPEWVPSNGTVTADPPTSSPDDSSEIFEEVGLNLPRWINETLDSRLDLAAADEHMRSSPSGLIIYVLDRVFKRFQDGLFSSIVTTITFWLATYFLLSPLWRWQLEDLVTRFFSMLYFGFGTLFIPLFIAWTTQQEQGRALNTDSYRQWLVVFFLKYVGATTAFNAVAVGYFIILVLPFSFFEPTRNILASNGLWLFLSLFPVLLGYVAAQRIPVDRLKLFGVDPQMHEADKIFGLIMSFLGPGTAFGIYVAYEGFQNPLVGWIVLLFFVNYGVWQSRKNADGTQQILLTVLQFTVFLPSLVLIVYGIMNLPSLDFAAATAQISAQTIMVVAILLSYPILLGATYIITMHRNPPQMSFEGIIGLIALVILIWIVYVINPTWGAIMFMLPLTVYPLVHNRLKPHFWGHPSMVVALLLIILSAILGLRELIPIWLNLLGFWAVAAGLMWWGFQNEQAK